MTQIGSQPQRMVLPSIESWPWQLDQDAPIASDLDHGFTDTEPVDAVLDDLAGIAGGLCDAVPSVSVLESVVLQVDVTFQILHALDLPIDGVGIVFVIRHVVALDAGAPE